MVIPHWSYSALRQYLDCPLRFFFQRVLALPEKSVSVNLVAGSAVHAALAEYHHGIVRDETTDPAKLHKIIGDTWIDRERNANVVYRDGESRNDLIAKAVTLVETYLREPPPQNIIGIEQYVTAPIHNSQGEYLTTPLVAVMDLITEANKELTVHEFKTSSRNYSEAETHTSLQATCYSAAVRETKGIVPKVEYAVLVKTRTPKVQRLKTLRTVDDHARLGDLIQAVEKAIESDIFYPNESPLHCSGCPYRGPCKSWGSSS